MRNIFFIVLWCHGALSCTAGVQAGSPETKPREGNFLTSGPAMICYGLIAGLIAAWLWCRFKERNSRQVNGVAATLPPDMLVLKEQVVAVNKACAELEKEKVLLEKGNKEWKCKYDDLQRRLDESDYRESRSPANSEHVFPGKPGNGAVPYGGRLEKDEPPRLYFLQPTTDGRFKQSGRVDNADQAVYELTLQVPNGGEASLKFVDTPGNTSLAVQNEAAWILLVCERSNLPSATTTSVRTDVPGKAVLRNGEWEIVQKAVITYL